MKDIRFRAQLRKMLEEDKEDLEIINFVLEHTWEQWPRPLLIWFQKRIKEYDLFK